MSIEDYILNPIKLCKKKKNDWLDLWIKKSDYITDYYKNIKGKYDIIDESIDYYIAMLEMCIYYLKDYFDYSDYVYIQHNIIMDNDLCVKEDIKERDFAEYLKYLFYNEYGIDYVYDLIENNYNRFNYYLVGIRLLFPSYYFYYFERIINDNKDYDKLCEVINNASDYEDYLKSVINKINNYLIKKIVLPF